MQYTDINLSTDAADSWKRSCTVATATFLKLVEFNQFQLLHILYVAVGVLPSFFFFFYKSLRKHKNLFKHQNFHKFLMLMSKHYSQHKSIFAKCLIIQTIKCLCSC